MPRLREPPSLRLVAWTAFWVFLLDQATKWAVLSFLEPPAGPVEVAPYFNLVLVWNRGVSFGVLDDHAGAYMPWVLAAVALAIVAFLLAWLRRADGALAGTALGLVIGGAIGNVVDRVRFGAVVDFLDFHVAGYHWPAFNLADAAICVGAGLLLVSGLFVPRREAT